MMNVQVITSPQRFNGQVRYTGKLSGTSKWKTGALTLTKVDGGWNLKMTYDCNNIKTPNHSVLNLSLTSRTIEKCVCKESAFVDVRTSKELMTVFFKGTRRSDITALKQIFEDAKFSSSKAPAEKSEISVVRQPQISPAQKTPFSTASGHTDNVPMVNGMTSPQRFTSVKENRRQERQPAYLDDSSDDGKENQHATPLKPGDKFLQRSGEKSRQCLGTLGSFYGSATPKSFYNSTPTISSQWLNSKRGPGLMPDPTPIKRPRLSDSVPYSMKAKATTPDHKQQPALQGFSNLGNTCYMNAILQSLFGLDTLSIDLITTNRRLLKTLSPQSLYSSLVKLLCSRRQNASDLSRRDYLRRVKTAISNTAKRFSGNGQHDAHEFLGQVLDQLKEEVITINKSTPSPPRETTNDTEEFVSPTSRNFEFEVLHTIACEHCQENVTNTEQFHDVSVDLPRRKDMFHPRSLQDALSVFFREEQIEYTCEKCGHNKSNVTHKFVRLPRVFILHLKRYSYNQMFSRNTKVGQNVSIPLYLTLDSHCDEVTQPAFPVPIHDVCNSEQKSAILLDDSKEDTPSRRKLDYPGFKFKKTTSVATTTASELTCDLTSPSKVTDDVKKEDGGGRPTATLEDEHDDADLTRAIEMSLKEHEEQEQMLRDFGEDNEGNFQRAIDMSAVVKKDLNSLSEEELIQLAIEESLRETDGHHYANYTRTDDVTDSCAQDYTHYNGVTNGKEHGYSTSYDIGPDVFGPDIIKENGSRTNSDEIIKCCSDVVMSSNNVVMSDNVSTCHSVMSSSDAVMSTSCAVMSSSNAVMSSSNVVMSSSNAVMSSDDMLSSSQGSTSDDAVRSKETEHLTKIEDKNVYSSSSSRKFKRNSFFDRLKNAKFSSDEDEPSGRVSDSSITHLPKSLHSNSDCNSTVTKLCDLDTKCESNNAIKTPFNAESSDGLSLITSDDESDNCENCDRMIIRDGNKSDTRSTLVGEDSSQMADSQKDMFSSLSDDVDMKNCESLNWKKVDENMNEIQHCDKTTSKNASKNSQNHRQNVSTNMELGSTEDCDLVGSNLVNEKGDEVMNDSGINSDCEIISEAGDNVKQPVAEEVHKPRHRSSSDSCALPESASRLSNSEHSSETQLANFGGMSNTQRKCQLTNVTNGDVNAATKSEVNGEIDKGQSKVTEGHSKVTVEDIPQFNCDEDDSWIFALDEKENTLPSHPTLSDPSDEVAATDEVDGFIEEHLNIPEIHNEKGELPYSYRLVSVVNHMGVSSSTGHYISDVYDIKKRVWNSFDDAHVTKMSESDVISTRERTGYIFFYLSKDLFDDLCLQHSISTTSSHKTS